MSESTKDIIPNNPENQLSTTSSEIDLKLGQEWLYVKQVCSQVEKILVDAGKNGGHTQDWNICQAFMSLVNTTLQEDRKKHFLADFSKIDLISNELNHNDKINYFQKLITIYELNENEASEWILNYNKAKIFRTQLEKPTIKRGIYNQDQAVRFSYYKFCGVDIEYKNGKATIKLNRPSDGNVNDVAFPLSELKIDVEVSGVKSNFKDKLSTDDSVGFFNEIKNHPEIIIHLQKELVKIIDLYRTNPKEFIQGRSAGANDSTLITSMNDFLIKKYLPSKLGKSDMNLVTEALNFLNDGKYEAVLRLIILEETVIDENGSIRTNNYFNTNHPNEIKKLAEMLISKFIEFGLRKNPSQPVNPEYVLGNVLTGHLSLESWINLWKDIFESDNKIMRHVKDNINQETYNRMTLAKRMILRRALKWARNEVIIPNNNRVKSFFDLFL